MNSAIVLLFGVAAMLCGYVFYSKFIATKILALDNSRPTPAHTMKDGIDYVPTNKYVLWGHQFYLSSRSCANYRSCHCCNLGLGACHYLGGFRHYFYGWCT